jgi:TonB family protein
MKEIGGVIPSFAMVFYLTGFLLLPTAAHSQDRTIADSAMGLMGGGHFDDAIKLLKHAVDDQKNSTRFHRLLGEAYHRTHDYSNSIDSYGRAASLEDCDTCHQDYDSLGAVSLEMKDYGAAQEYAEKASRRHSGFADRIFARAHILKGDEYSAKGECDKALGEYQNSLKLIEDTLAYRGILSCYSFRDDTKELLELSTRLLDRIPDFYAPRKHLCEAYYDAGLILESRQDFRAAIGWFEKALSMDPLRASDLAIEIGKCYEILNDTSRAIQYYSNALFDTAASSEAAIALSRIYIRRDQFAYALKTLQTSLKGFPVSGECWVLLGDLYLKLGKKAEAIESDKIAAKLGDRPAQDRLRNNYIPYDSIDYNVLSWLGEDPFAKKWWEDWSRGAHLGAPDFVPVERLPVPSKVVQPEYPQEARRSGSEGTIWVKCLVDKRGRVLKAVVAKSDNDVLIAPSVTAALQWQFTPATLHGVPVAVWTMVPFRFKLNR